MTRNISSLSPHYRALSGGDRNYRDWKLSRRFHPDGYLRQELMMSCTLTLMARAELTADDIPAVTHIIHTPSPLLSERETLWSYAAASNLHFYFSAAVLKKSICDLSDKDVDLTAEEKDALNASLLPAVNYQTGPVEPRGCS